MKIIKHSIPHTANSSLTESIHICYTPLQNSQCSTMGAGKVLFQSSVGFLCFSSDFWHFGRQISLMMALKIPSIQGMLLFLCFLTTISLWHAQFCLTFSSCVKWWRKGSSELNHPAFHFETFFPCSVHFFLCCGCLCLGRAQTFGPVYMQLAIKLSSANPFPLPWILNLLLSMTFG